ncbi:MAG: YaiO family outer membrane beta-barrel protein [Fidelibacterota bacterium]
MKQILSGFLVCTAAAAASYPPTQIATADSALSAGDYATALRVYSEYLEKDSTSYPALMGIARSLAYSGESTQALETYTRLLSLYPGDPDALLGRGRTLAWEKRFAEAERDLVSVVERYPSYSDAWSALGNLYVWSGDLQKARGTLSRWMEELPDDPGPYLALAKVNRSERRFQKARKNLRIAQEKGGNKEEIDRLLRTLNRIVGATPWEGTFLYTFQSFTQDRPSWHTYAPSIRRDIPKGSVRFVVLRTVRFSQWDDLIALDSYLDLWRRSYGNFYVETSTRPGFLPRLVFSGEIFQGVGNGWELSISYRNMRWTGNPVSIWGGSLAKYVGALYLRGRATLVPKASGSTLSVQGFGRLYLDTVDDFVEMGIGLGREVGSSLESEAFGGESLLVSVRGETFLTKRIGVAVSAVYERNSGYESRNVSLGIKHRW